MRQLLLPFLFLLLLVVLGRPTHAFCTLPSPLLDHRHRVPPLFYDLLLLHVAYDGSQCKAWKDENDQPSTTASGNNNNNNKKKKKQKGHYAAHPPSLHTKVGTALSIIHSHASLPSLVLTPAIVPQGGVHAQAQLLSYHPPTIPFEGDLERTAHSLNRILSEDLRVIGVHPLPWQGFDLTRDLVQATYSYTVMLGPVHDPMLRHSCWLYTPPPSLCSAGQMTEEGMATMVEKIKTVAASTKDSPWLLQDAVIEAAWGPGVHEARARLIRFKMEVRPSDGHLEALLAWVGRVVRKACENEDEEGEEAPSLNGVVLEALRFEEVGGGGKSWAVEKAFGTMTGKSNM